VRAVKSARAAGVKVEIVEVITPDGTTIRVCGQRDANSANPWDEVLASDEPNSKVRP
jgi:hypothetical protein